MMKKKVATIVYHLLAKRLPVSYSIWGGCFRYFFQKTMCQGNAYFMW